jgi:hypothetical protein
MFPPSIVPSLKLEDTGKPLKSQGLSDPRLTSRAPQVTVRASSLTPMLFSFTPAVRPNLASYWWWYGTAAEGAPASV